VGDAEEAEEVIFLICLEEECQVVVLHSASHLSDRVVAECITQQEGSNKGDSSISKTPEILRMK
jgi:hypothetical protein